MIWLLSLLPTAFVGLIIHAILIAGIVGLLLSIFTNLIPQIQPYSFILRIVSYVLIVVGVFYEGVLYNQKVWEEKVASLEAQIKLSQEKSKTINEEIKTKYVTKVERIKETEYIIQEKIKENKEKIDAQCVVPTEAIEALNDAAKGNGQ